MRLREDSYHEAGHKRAVLLGATPDPRQDTKTDWDPLYLRQLNEDSFEAAQPGDVWRFRYTDPQGHPGRMTPRLDAPNDWPIAGYALTCPNERCPWGVHLWDHAHNCPAPFEPCKYNRWSCWQWSGSAEDGTLTASPSLHMLATECGWHGWLKNGEMVLA